MKECFHPGQFWLPGIFDTETLGGWHNPTESWNGYACPCFERPEVMRLVRKLNLYEEGREVAGEEREYIYTFEDNVVRELNGADDGIVEQDWNPSTIITPEGEKEVWFVGAYGWTWELEEPMKGVSAL